MPKKSDVIIRISGSAESLSNEFKRIQKDSQALENALSKASKISATAFAGLAGGIGLAVSQAAKFEQIETQFQTLTGSAQKATKVIKNLSDFSARTPFAFEDIANAGKQLIAFGFEAETVTDRLQEIGDVSAATGANFKEVSLIFGQISAAGKLTGERLLQLQERAIPIGPALAETMGVAEESIKDLVSKGQVDFETFQKAFASLSAKGGIAFKGLEKQSNTLGGQLSTLKDNFVLIVAALGKQFLPAIKSATKSMTAFLQVLRNNPEITKVAGIVLGIGTALAGLATVLSTTALVALKFITTWKALNATLGLTPKLAAAAKASFIGIKRVLGFFAKNPLALLALAIVTLILSFKEVRSVALATFSGIYNGAIELGNNLKKIFSDLGNLITAAFSFDTEKITASFEKLKGTLLQAGLDSALAFKQGFDEELDYQAAQEKLEEALETQKEKLEVHGEELGELEAEQLTRREELEAAHREQMANIAGQFRDAEIDADLRYHRALIQADLKEKKQRTFEEQKFGKQNAKIRAFFRSEDVKNFKSTLGALSSLMSSGSRRLFELGKASSIARATINIAEGVTKAWSRGPLLGPIGAAAVGIAGAVQLANIAGTTFQAQQGFSGSGSPFGERFVSTFTPREIVVPERFSEGIKKGEFALTRREDSDGGFSGQERKVSLELSFVGDAAELIEVKKIEDQRTGTFVNG